MCEISRQLRRAMHNKGVVLREGRLAGKYKSTK